ncbi:hypothetical protein BDF20DRAFT_822269 [Mycotypha africana]|uniref:uncharacterized protein n=1 Tax=Mycotypha africana TaxID=64632 RepID=UPI0023017091|nr:uncharacterized protein BDF20DRAFT_822269 [Mycotypha africana]KAI8975437.1 hypothetical protein BDF20DRAFT_822269 [Mycotypha africana]
MFFETTYVPSPTLSASPVEQTEPVQNLADIEPDSDRPVDHLIFVIHQTEQYGHFYEHSKVTTSEPSILI